MAFVGTQSRLRASGSSPATDRRRLLACLGGLVSLGLAAASVVAATGRDAGMALVFGPGLLLTLVLVHDLGRPGRETSNA